jgi:hypothetical protein
LGTREGAGKSEHRATDRDSYHRFHQADFAGSVHSLVFIPH